MTKRVSCIHCAKRKVRCDRQEPCAHCKRRKIEDCTYPDEDPAARIRHLEALVRSLGHDPDVDGKNKILTLASPATATARPRSLQSQQDQASHQSSYSARVAPDSDPLIVENEGEKVYLESSSFHSWDRSDSRLYTPSKRVQSYFMTEFGSCALQNIIKADDKIDLVDRHPSLPQSNILWDTYYGSVEPLCKVSFKWELEQVHRRVLSRDSLMGLNSDEFALVFAIYMHSVICLSEDECTRSFSQSRLSLLSEYQMLCENALAKAKFLGRSEVLLIQACTIYISASIDRLSTRSLWTFIGIVLRHAERLGFHREGTILNLSPFETEKRRRIWWQLQHYDMALAIRSGSQSLLLMADWDSKLPLNIEDDDIGPWSTNFPEERSGLTDMSFCLWTYYILERQREFRRADGSRVGTSWMADRSVSPAERGRFINSLEEAVETKFLRHCDPINPKHMLLSITGRSFTANMRRLITHSDALTKESAESSEASGKKTLDQCLRCLEYDILLHSQKYLERFQWRLKGFFPWHALVYVITDASRRVASPEADQIWEAVGRLFSVNSELLHFSGDRRKPRAAEMVLLAWKTYEQSTTQRGMEAPKRPPFLDTIEKLLAQAGIAESQNPSVGLKDPTSHTLQQSDVQTLDADVEPSFDEGILNMDYSTLNNVLNLDANDIDWSFWSQWEQC